MLIPSGSAILSLLAAGLFGGVFSDAPHPPPFGGRSGPFVSLNTVDAAPAASLTGLDGRPLSLTRYRGRVVVLNLWAPWCEPCIAEMDALERLAQMTDPQRIAVVAVSVDDTPAGSAERVASSHHLAHIDVAVDTTHRLAALRERRRVPGALPVFAVPTTYILDPGGRIVGYLTGVADWTSPQALALLKFFQSSGSQ
jgi:thiol-disulfide isomerase/thioredoxin